ncbi:DUF1947 domain-containing protein [Candidatus Woesearchaeota archaeon]|nr:DUF1947 domain-containing protein [Candidatus Woesearchaeota archaeon]
MKQQLSKNDIWQLSEELKKNLRKSDLVTPRDRVELVDSTIYLVNDQPRFFKLGDRILPTLRSMLDSPGLLKKVVVDMGAIPFVTKGADVMRPGIRDWDADIAKGEIVVIVDEKFSKPIAVGEALHAGTDLKTVDKGPCVKNLHYVGDRIWSM